MTRKQKEIEQYLNEAFDKVWYMRSIECDNPEIEQRRLKQIERIEQAYPEVLEGVDDWECGYWNGIMVTLRWVLGEDDKNMLDT